MQVGVLNRLVLNRLGGSTAQYFKRRDGGRDGRPPLRPKDPVILKNATVIVIHYGGSKTLRRQPNATAGSLKRLVLLGKIHWKCP